MSILIKGMDMPKNCGECRLNTMYGLPFASDGWCFAMSPTEPNNKSLATKTRPPHCPLTEVSAHGKLIDADALKEKSVEIQEHLWNKINDADANIIMEDDVRFRLYEEIEDYINNAPTIIEAEGK